MYSMDIYPILQYQVASFPGPHSQIFGPGNEVNYQECIRESTQVYYTVVWQVFFCPNDI